MSADRHHRPAVFLAPTQGNRPLSSTAVTVLAKPARSGRWFPGLILTVLVLAAMWPPSPARAAGRPTYYAGWALEAYPETAAAEMEATVRRMVEAGANVVWIGHNNPGEVSLDKAEPGLSYAVYQASQDLADPRHPAALAILEANHRLLAACRAVGVKAVLPVGYQIQMGERWNQDHPGDLRRDARGAPLDIYGGGVSASFYAPSYRLAIESYYRWVDKEFVRPYADVLLMLNLADEPIGGDYSAHAEAAFRRRTGLGFADVPEGTPAAEEVEAERQRLLGEFQSRYVVDYATYSAELWAAIHPGLAVTLSFDGGQARKTLTQPDVEALFRDTPSNLVITFDAYPRDGQPRLPLDDTNLVGLFLLARSLGLYSAHYQKPVWLWAAANSWGLSQPSPDPGTVSDAVANGLALAMLVRQAGGDLRGIVYWNYNVKGQGLYNEPRETAYDAETMFRQVSARLPTLRGLMASPAGSPRILVLAPAALAQRAIGASREAVRLEVLPYQKLAILARTGVNAAVVGSLAGLLPTPGPFDPASAAGGVGGMGDGAGVGVVIVLSPAAGDLSGADLEALRGLLARGGKVVASPGVGSALSTAGDPVAEPVPGAEGLIECQGNLFVAPQGVAILFEDKRSEALLGFWQEVLGLDSLQPGYQVRTERTVWHYQIGREPITVELDLPFEAVGYRYDAEGRAVERLSGFRHAATLGRREYLLLRRVARSGQSE